MKKVYTSAIALLVLIFAVVQAKAANKDVQVASQTMTEKAICSECSNKAYLQKARELYAKAQFDAALEFYNKIPKSSDLWFEAAEEKAWIAFKKDDFEKSLAQVKTLLSPQFSEVIQPEVYFLQALNELKICDYEGVLKTTELFKTNHRSRILAMQELSKSGINPALAQLLKSRQQQNLNFNNVGEVQATMPIAFYRDKKFQRLYSEFTQNSLKQTKSETQRRELLEQIKKQVQFLAQQELKTTAQVVQKLNLVEVEAIQRIHTDIELSQNLYKKNDFKKTTDDQLVFMDDGQPWIDELDKYEVASKYCAKNIRRKM